MFEFFKKPKSGQSPDKATQTVDTPSSPRSDQTEKASLTKKMRQGLQHTRYHFQKSLHQIFHGNQTLQPEHFRRLKDALLSADVGLSTTQHIIKNLQTQCQQEGIVSCAALWPVFRRQLIDMLQPLQRTLTITPQSTPTAILMIGMNGAGKTTTLGKMTHRFQQQGHTVMLAAGDTFRAAAIDQLQVWGQRCQVPVVAQQPGADSGAVLFDALQSATHQGINVLLADTAGRLHTKHNLMAELKKIKKVMQKIDPQAPQETLLVLDASIGQNSLQQARHFHETMALTGLIMTKLDGTGKGGALLGIAHELALPICMMGVGEQLDDLQDFDAESFVDAILPSANDLLTSAQ